MFRIIGGASNAAVTDVLKTAVYCFAGFQAYQGSGCTLSRVEYARYVSPTVYEPGTPPEWFPYPEKCPCSGVARASAGNARATAAPTTRVLSFISYSSRRVAMVTDTTL
jgi:hypothetical protein